MKKAVLFIALMLQCVLFATTSYQAGETLEAFLQKNGCVITEGHLTSSQRQLFNLFLEERPEIRSIVEIGLNAGHSCENFFQHCPHLERFLSLDINYYPYVRVAVSYLSQKYGSAFHFIAGDSKVTLPQYANYFPQDKYDLIYVDGDHRFRGALRDILNAQKLAHKDTILLVDDYNMETVARAVRQCEQKHIIKIDKIVTAADRCWVEAHYTLTTSQ
jgi:predicted O-methyltransferase YrrM